MQVKIRYVLRSMLYAFSIMILATACKSSKNIIASGKASEKLSAKQVIKAHQKQDANFKTLQAKVRIDITQNEKEQGSTFNLRMEKDKVIWLSAKLGLARMIITPEKVKFYSKLDNQYFDGDYKLLSDFVGVDLDFYKVQNLLLGQAIYSLKDKAHQVDVNENSYALQPKDQSAIFELFYLINPSHFKLDSLQLYQQLQRRMLQVDYQTYQEVSKEVFPKEMRIIAVENTDQVTIAIDYKSINLNDDLRFPFKIPSGYDEIIIK